MTAVLDDATPREAWAWARGVLRAHRGRVVATTACFLAATVAGLVGPQLLGALVDEVVSGGRSTARVDLIALAFAVSLLVTAVLRRSARWRAGVLGEELLAANRTGLVDRALTLPLATVESVGTGALLSRATTDLDRVDSALRQGVPEVVTAAVTVVLTVVAMVVTSPLLALALLVAVPTVVLPTRWLWRYLPGAMHRMLDTWAGLASRVHESTAGARTLDALGLVERRVAGDDAALVAGVDRERDLRALHVRWIPWLEISHVLPLAAMLALGAWAHAAGLASLGDVTTMVVYVQALATPLDEALWWVEDLVVATVALRRVLGVRVPDTTRVPASPARPERGLHLEAVRFAYRADRPVLRGVDLHVPRGERLAVVGGSGAGKSTLARLVAGICAPTSGSVRLDGRDVAALDDDTLRGEVLLLTQEHHVFTGSVRDNLALPAGTFADDELASALALVGLGDWFTTLPAGLDTAVGAGAVTVPAPAAQQLALARVVLADPGTVVLDEATSLLDTVSARQAEGALDRVLAGRTVIAIAHRLHTAARADRVAVMADGEIVELGPPAALLAADGPYARLVAAAVGLRRTGPARRARSGAPEAGRGARRAAPRAPRRGPLPGLAPPARSGAREAGSRARRAAPGAPRRGRRPAEPRRTGTTGRARALWRATHLLEVPCPTRTTRTAPVPRTPCSRGSWAGWSTSTSVCSSGSPAPTATTAPTTTADPTTSGAGTAGTARATRAGRRRDPAPRARRGGPRPSTGTGTTSPPTPARAGSTRWSGGTARSRRSSRCWRGAPRTIRCCWGNPASGRPRSSRGSRPGSSRVACPRRCAGYGSSRWTWAGWSPGPSTAASSSSG